MDTGGDEARELAHGIVGSARVIAFGTSIVAPAVSVITVLVVMVSYAGFASPLVVVITFAGSLCCAISIAEFARRVPSAGWAYTYNCRGLGRAAGFLTGWMMIFGYALFVPAGVALTSTYASQLLADDVLHVTIGPWVLFVVILAIVILLAYLGIGISSSADLLLVAGEMAVIAALSITILVKIGPAHYPMAVFSPASVPYGQLTGITNAGDLRHHRVRRLRGRRRARRGSEEHAPVRPRQHCRHRDRDGCFLPARRLRGDLGCGAGRHPGFLGQASPLGYLAGRYWSPSALWVIDLVVMFTGLGFVIAAFNAAIRILFAMGRERALPGALTRISGRHTPVVAIGCLAVVTAVLGLPLTYADGGARAFGYLAGAGGLAVVLVYLAGNIAVIRAFRTEFSDEFRLGRHLLIPATAAVIFLFPLWGILHPPAYTLMNLLPFAALGWLCIGAIAAGVLRARRPATFEALGTVFMSGEK